MSLAQIHRLFVELFAGNDELIRFLDEIGAGILPALPSSAVSRDAFSFRVVELLRARGCLDLDLFQALARRFPRRVDVIGEAAAPFVGATLAEELVRAIRTAAATRASQGTAAIAATSGVRDEKLRILLLTANPDDRRNPALACEAGAVEDAFGARHVAHRVELHRAWDVDASEFAAQLLKFRPHVLHFAGQGNRQGEPMLIRAGQDAGQSAPLTALRRLFRQVPELRCVVLNAGYTAKVAQELALELDVVVGMCGELAAASALAFAQYFYRTIAEGRSLQTAFEVSRSVVELNHPPSGDLVQLSYAPGVDPRTIVLLPR